MHQRKEKILHNAIWICVILLFFYSISANHLISLEGLSESAGSWLFHTALKNYMTSMYCAEEVPSSKGDSLLVKGVNYLFPLGAYIERGQEVDVDWEDSDTLERMLAKNRSEQKDVEKSVHSSLDEMDDFEYLLSNYYMVDGSTVIRPDELHGKEWMQKNLRIDASAEEPRILIYHTHSQEAFADSIPGKTSTSIVGVGEYLTKLLNETYHIPTIHHTGVYDLIDGKLDRSRAYDLAKPEIAKILKEHPSIQVVIDLHRDGVREGTHLVTEVNGKPAAKIMFFNGLSRSRTNGEIDYLANPYIQDNLAFSLQMQAAAYEKYPGFARRIYLRGYRYNMHLAPRCLLIEAGAQTNTIEEMKNAMEPLADLLNTVLVGSDQE